VASAARSFVLSIIRGVQRAAGWVLLLGIFGFLILFGLQFPHGQDVDTWRVVIYLRVFGNPLISRVASLFDWSWPSASISFLPLVLGFATWMVKLGVDAVFLQANRLLVGREKGAEAEVGLPGLGGVPLDERSREELLKRYREIEDALKSSRRKRCAFLSVDVVGSSRMKEGEADTAVAATFQAYEEMLREIFEQHAAWKQAWTPDGVMVCFLQLDLALAAGKRVLQGLKEFNQSKNKLRTSFRVRCGLNEGEVAIFEDSKMEKIVDHSIDIAGHMQKEGRPNTLWLSAEVYNLLADKVGFRRTTREVDGLMVYEWALEPALIEPSGVKPVAAPRAPAAQPGGAQRIGRYEVVGELGRGAMGAVYKARDPQIGRTVAIKIILTANLSEEELEEYKQRFYREAQTAGQMSHSGIVTIYDVAEDEIGQPYLVMEFIEGKTLDKMLAPPKSGKAEPRNLKQMLDIAYQVADALDYAHRRNVIHRDIKPANILVTAEGKAKIADFGIAKLAGTQMTHTGLLVGTPAFMAPEQITGGGADARSDIFSFGVMLYWMCTGQRPFAGKAITEVAYKVVHAEHVPARQLNAELPPGLDVILARCLAKKPEERYPSARDLAADLEALKHGQPVGAASLPSAQASGS
jgi:class 3 adenylate cyclase/tRNA A-37 threonylcarbamoyl transferase component Bud32